MILFFVGDFEFVWLFCMRKWLGFIKLVGGIFSVLGYGGFGVERIFFFCFFEGRYWLRVLSIKFGIWFFYMRFEIWIVWKFFKFV